MKELPLISVIVPVYKVEAYLDKCISSITEQTYRNLEILLVDDGSPDGSSAICDVWAARDARVKVLHKENGGGGQARNAALEIAQGGLIAFVDSDDYIAPDMFSYLYGLLEDGADIAECGFTVTEDDSARFPQETPAVTTWNPRDAMAEHIRDTIFRQLIWNKLYRREVIGEIRFPVGTKIDDEFFTYRVLSRAKRLVHSDRVCYAYRQQPGSVMHEYNPNRYRDGLKAKQQRLEFLKDNMPELVYEAKFDLFFTCMFAMQGCLRTLRENELEEARKVIGGIVAQITPLQANGAASKKKNILLKLAQVNFEGTCKLLNFLIDIHVLT